MTPSFFVQTAEADGDSGPRNAAMQQTAEPVGQRRDRRSIAIGPLSGRSSHIAHYLPRVDLSDLSYRTPAGSYSQAKEFSSPKRVGADAFLKHPSRIGDERRAYWGRKA
jgi:hypothetical protein